MKTVSIIVSLGLLLAACGSEPVPSGNVTVAAAAIDPTEAKIDTLSDSQRKTAFFRAIYDADYQCDRIEKVEGKPRNDGKPVWVATCDDQGEYVITLQPGGIFTVSGVPQAKRRMPKSTVVLPVGTK